MKDFFEQAIAAAQRGEERSRERDIQTYQDLFDKHPRPIVEHELFKSNRVKGRFAFDTPEGSTLSDYHPIILKLGKFAIPGTVRTDTDTSWFVAEGGTFQDDRIEMREGLIVREDR